MNRFSRMKVASKLALGFGLIVLLMIIIGGLAYFGLKTSEQTMNDINDDKVPKMQATAQINYHVLDIARNLRNALMVIDNPEQMEVQIERVLASRGKIKDIVENLKVKVTHPEGKLILGRILEARTAFIDGQNTIIKLLRERKSVEAREFLLTEMRKRQGVYADATNELQAFQEKLVKEASDAAKTQSNQAITLIVLILLASIALSVLIAWLIIRDLVAQLGGEPADAAAEVSRIAAGDLSANITLRLGDTTSLLASLKFMQEGLNVLVGEIRNIVDAAARGDFTQRIALDGKQGFGKDIGSALNQLADVTNTGLSDVMRVAQALSEGDLNQRIERDYPGIFGQTGSAVNATVEALKLIIRDIDRIVQAANQGDFSVRTDLTGKQGFGKDISASLNNLVDVTNTGLVDVMRVVQALAAGDLNQRIERNYPGVFGQTGNAVNATTDALKLIVSDINRIVLAANQGDFSIRTNLTGKQGFGRELSELLNQLSETTESGLKDILRVANTLAQGDLTQTIDKDYPGLFGETRNGINTTVSNLTALIGQLKDSVALINTAASEIAAGNQDLSSRTEEQASSLEETASSMEELTSTVKENTEGANTANRDAQAAAEVAARGGATVKGSVAVMEEISDSSKKIADIVGVIDSIAFQTNILALNAAVEAARAGEQGRGFAVVATEVRNLAKRSADAAREIKALIGDTLSRIDNGAAQATLAGRQMDEIVGAIANVSKVINDIAAAGVEQSTGIEQVTQAVSQMDEVTQQNAALVEEAAAAAESLREQAEQLSQAIAQFKLAGSHTMTSATSLASPQSAHLRNVAKLNAAQAARTATHSIPTPPAKPSKKPALGALAHANTGNDEWAEF